MGTLQLSQSQHATAMKSQNNRTSHSSEHTIVSSGFSTNFMRQHALHLSRLPVDRAEDLSVRSIPEPLCYSVSMHGFEELRWEIPRYISAYVLKGSQNLQNRAGSLHDRPSSYQSWVVYCGPTDGRPWKGTQIPAKVSQILDGPPFARPHC